MAENLSNIHAAADRRPTLRRILTELRPARALILLSLLLAVISVVLTLYIPICIGDAVNRLAGRGRVDFAGLLPILRRILWCLLGTAAAQWTMNHVNNLITYRIVRNLRIEAFHHLQVLPVSYLDSHSSGDLLSRVITDIEQFSDGLLLGFSQLFTGCVTILGTILIMLTIQPWITLIVVIFTPLSFSAAGFISKKTFLHFHKQSAARGAVTDLTNEMLTEIKTVQIFGREKDVCDEFDRRSRKLAESSLKATFFSSITNPSTRFLNALIYLGVTAAGCILCFGPVPLLSIGRLTSFLSYVKQFSQPFNEISGVITEFQNSLASAARVFELLDENPEAPEPEDAAILTLRNSQETRHSDERQSGKIVFDDVSFSYVPERPLIRHLDLTVEPGTRIAIVGPTGSGKTTLINLLMRFYDVCDGSIRIDGHDIHQITRASLRKNCGMVLQETWLKAGTIRENIAYGMPEATDEMIENAARKAHAHSFIMRLPGGYGYMVEENGENLSAGQRQLLCIARVMLCLPPVLILDEATSSIDSLTEIRIQKAFDEMMQGRTSFVVAHRLSTVRNADIILVMKDGDIIEQGNHDQLMKQNGLYAQLYESQFAQA